MIFSRKMLGRTGFGKTDVLFKITAPPGKVKSGANLGLGAHNEKALSFDRA
jgi:hypothetical protein